MPAMLASTETVCMAEVRRLIVAGRYENIPTITDFVGEAATAAGLGQSEVFHCQMAVDEACTNIVEHAYGGEGRGEIMITCTVEPGVCEVVLIDEGEPFDPTSVPVRSYDSQPGDLEPGGIGLHLMQQFMDEVSFEFGEHRNKLTMIKRGSQASAVPSQPGVRAREVREGVWIVTPEGRLDSAAAPALEQALTDLLDHGHVWLVVDMQNVAYISSRGLKALVSAWRRSRAAGGDVLLCSMPPHVLAVFETVGFTRLFAILDDCDAALAAAGAADA